MNQRDGFDVFRQIGKAWATAPRPVRSSAYIKEGRTVATGIVHCRGERRAAKRRLYLAVLKEARRALA